MSDTIPTYVIDAALDDPMDWDEGGHVHNWRNHVGQHVRAIWPTLTADHRIAIAADADERAGAEEWE